MGEIVCPRTTKLSIKDGNTVIPKTVSIDSKGNANRNIRFRRPHQYTLFLSDTMPTAIFMRRASLSLKIRYWKCFSMAMVWCDIGINYKSKNGVAIVNWSPLSFANRDVIFKWRNEKVFFFSETVDNYLFPYAVCDIVRRQV